MSKPFNPRTLNPSEIPDTWDPIDRDLAERLRPDRYGLRTKEQQKEIDRIRAARWLLLRNDTGARCGRCNAVHPYITSYCVERPFNTLHEIHMFEMQTAREQGLVRGENLIVDHSAVKSMRLGAPVPISRKDAKKLMLRIRVRGGRGAI